ncbi:MAG: YIP1 family protein [Anaerolineales bacterium]
MKILKGMRIRGTRRLLALAALAVLALVVARSSLPARADSPYSTWAVGPGGDLFMTQDAYSPVAEMDLPTDGPEDLYVMPDGTIYVADTGHGQILKLKNFQVAATYGQDVLKGPTGIFVDEQGTMYVADGGQNAVVILDRDGKLVNQFGRPAEPLFGKDREFLPRKLVVDARRNVFIVSEGSVNGIVQMNAAGNFIGYFGANASTMSLKMILQRMFLTKQQLAQFIKNEAASPSNIAIDRQGLIYTVTGGTGRFDAIKRFTVSGKNIFPGAYGSTTFRDIQVSDNGLMLAVDSDGYIVEYDQNGALLFLFVAADTGDQRLGTVRNPTAIDRFQENVYVLDKDKNAIVVYATTAFARKVHDGVQLYLDGYYEEARPYFEDVLQYNGSFILSYQAIADADFKAGNYRQALAAYRTAGDRHGYSQAYWELRNQVLQRYLAPFLTWGLGLALAFNVFERVERRRGWLEPLRRARRRLGSVKLVDDFTFMFRFIRQPMDSFYYIKQKERGSLLFAGLIYIWVVAVWVVSLYVTGFPFARYSVLQWIRPETEALNLIVALGLWNAANYLVSTISDGEGRVRDVVIGTAYSLFPYALFVPPLVLISNVLTLNEIFLFQFSFNLIYVWTGLMLFFMVKEIHNYTFTETVRNVLLTLFTMGLFLLTGYILYVLFNQLFDFILAVVQEVGLRG